MSKTKKIKSPSSSSKTRSKIKEPSIDKIVNFDDCHPIFCLRYLENDYGLDQCTKDQQASFAKALRKRSLMTWHQIWSADRHGLGAEKIVRNSIQAPIPRHITEDIEYFIALRFSGKAPMVGYRINDVFRIIWLDRDFTLYKH